MSARVPVPPSPGADLDARLQAYHDGELRGLARWRLERRLRRDPELRRQCEALAALGEAIRASHVEAPSPDLWDAIALRLSAEDARRAETGTAARPRGLGWLAVPGAVTATAGLVLAIALGWFETEAPVRASVVHWLDSGGRDVMVLEDAPDTTIIWVFDAASEGASWGGERDTA